MAKPSPYQDPEEEIKVFLEKLRNVLVKPYSPNDSKDEINPNTALTILAKLDKDSDGKYKMKLDSDISTYEQRLLEREAGLMGKLEALTILEKKMNGENRAPSEEELRLLKDFRKYKSVTHNERVALNSMIKGKEIYTEMLRIRTENTSDEVRLVEFNDEIRGIGAQYFRRSKKQELKEGLIYGLAGAVSATALGLLIYGSSIINGADKGPKISEHERLEQADENVVELVMLRGERDQLEDKLESLIKVYNPEVRYDVSYNLGKNPEDFVLRLSNKKMPRKVNLINPNNWDNLLNAGAYHNFMNAAKLSGLDTYLTKEALNSFEDYTGEIEISKGKMKFFMNGKEEGQIKIDPKVLNDLRETYKEGRK